MIKVRETVGIALDNLRLNRLRSSLTVLGIIIGVGAVVSILSMVRGLNISVQEDIESKYFKKVLGEVIEAIEGGDNLHVAMRKHPRVFPELYVNVVQIGESTGSLDASFFDLARHFKRIDLL